MEETTASEVCIKQEYVDIKHGITVEVKQEPLQEKTKIEPGLVTITIDREYPDTETKGWDALPTDAQSYKCEKCPSSFANEANLSHHLETCNVKVGKRTRVECQLCKKTFKNGTNLKKHLQYVHSSAEDSVECQDCFRSFKSVAHLRSHVYAIHTSQGAPVTCPHCNKEFSNKKKLTNHIFYTHPSPDHKVACDVCKKHFKSKNNLKVHMRLVHPSGENSVQCPVCQKVFKANMLLQKHMKWTHPPDGMMYRCQICGRTLPSLSGFSKHMENVHTTENVVCNLCNKQFKTAANLRVHKKRVHDVIDSRTSKSYKSGDIPCGVCERTFSTNTALDWHFERSHSDNKLSNACEVCHKRFFDHGTMKRHKEMVHSLQAVKCEVCAKSFTSFLKMQRHIRTTHAPPEAARSCDVCHKIFKCNFHLTIHKNAVHATDGIFQCNVCEKVFNTKKYLTKHQKIHVSTRDYFCQICGKNFRRMDDVKQHAKRVHAGTEASVAVLPHKCDTCQTSFASAGCLEKHLMLQSEGLLRGARGCCSDGGLGVSVKLEVVDA